jgi:hypothetical protein
MKIKLEQISDIRSSIHIKPHCEGKIRYLVASDFDSNGSFLSESGKLWIPSEEGIDKSLLRYGDVLVASKGVRNFAWAYQKDIGLATASSMFLIVHPDPKKVLPQYLAIVLNQPQSQRYFQSLAAGTSIPSIRKSELGSFEFLLPSLAIQNKVIDYTNLHNRHKQITYQLLTEQSKIYKQSIKKMIYGK